MHKSCMQSPHYSSNPPVVTGEAIGARLHVMWRTLGALRLRCYFSDLPMVRWAVLHQWWHPYAWTSPPALNDCGGKRTVVEEKRLSRPWPCITTDAVMGYMVIGFHAHSHYLHPSPHPRLAAPLNPTPTSAIGIRHRRQSGVVGVHRTVYRTWPMRSVYFSFDLVSPT